MIYFLGDVHGNFDHILPALQSDASAEGEPKTCIFLGDIEAQRPFEDEIRPLLDAGVDVWFIHGNHDTDSRTNWANLLPSWHRNLHGRVVEIEGVRIAGLGGIFRGEVWYPDRPAMADGRPRLRNYEEYIDWLKAKTPPRLHAQVKNTGNALKHQTTIFPDTHAELANQKADILVTHEAPSCHPNGFKSIEQLAQAMGVKSLFHGHQHDCLNYRAWDDSLGFKAYGVGFRGILDMHGDKLLAGNFDEARLHRERSPHVEQP